MRLVPAFEKQTGHKAVVANDTAGGLCGKPIEGGEAFDLVVINAGSREGPCRQGQGHRQCH